MTTEVASREVAEMMGEIFLELLLGVKGLRELVMEEGVRNLGEKTRGRRRVEGLLRKEE